MTKQTKDILNELIKITRGWAAGENIDFTRAKALRNEAIQLNHIHYLENIPLYRKMAVEEGCGKDIDIRTIINKLMFAVDIFKSYEQTWLDDGDFGRMTRWLSGIYHKPIDIDVSGLKTIDDWITCLSRAGIHVVYSSGTSGTFSFVPRDKKDWDTSASANIACLAPLLARRVPTGIVSGRFMKSANRLMSAARMVAGQNGLSDYDAAFLGFRQGGMGNQSLISELAPLFSHRYFLYNTRLTGTALRCLRRGARTLEEHQLLSKFQEEIIGQEENHYIKFIDKIQKSIDNSQKIFIFGAPYQFKMLCESIAGNNKKLALKKGSLVLFGGGWKSFAGEAISREALAEMMTNCLDVPPQMILEGYSMTEINMLMLRCECGRFHIPPIIEPVVFDEELNALEGEDIKGAFGFLDPLAVSYSGFIISGDYVHMIDGECGCGLTGPAITEIGRLPGSEVKGCGGIMGSIRP